jgi:hypothetical protein
VIIPFATNSYQSKALPLSAQRMVNAYAEREPPDAKTQVAIFGVPGLTLFATCGTGPVRGMHVMGGVLYVVSGTTLYSVTSAGVSTALGGSVIGSGPVSMTDNGTQILIVNGVFGYIYSVANGFQIIVSANFHASSSATFFDNYFVLAWDGTNKFFISNSLDGTTYSGTDFASAEVSPDYVLSIVNQQENLLIFGQTTIETWYDAGSVNFPFQRIDGGTVERGCAAAMSPLKEDNSVFFLGDDRIFYRLDGTIPRRISTHAIEDAWQNYSIVSDAYTFSYTFEGHKFLVVNFPTANATWVHDLATGLWHERESWDIYNNNYGRWRGTCAASVYSKTLIGDNYSGQIGYLDNSTFTEFGNTIRALMVGPVINSDRKRIFMSRFELDVETGVGNTVDPGSNPQVMLDWSDDGGRTFKGFQPWQSMGKIGQYTRRLRWLRLGQSRNRMMRVTISDPVPRALIGAYADIAEGM